MEAEEAENAEIVLADALMGIADETHDARFQVFASAERIVKRAIRIAIKRVHGEVAPLRIGKPVAREGDIGAAPIRRNIDAQRGDLEVTRGRDGGDGAVADAGGHDLDALRLEQLLRAFRRLGCGDVDVANRLAHQRVAHAAADETRRAALRGERFHHGFRIRLVQPCGAGQFLFGAHSGLLTHFLLGVYSRLYRRRRRVQSP